MLLGEYERRCRRWQWSRRLGMSSLKVPDGEWEACVVDALYIVMYNVIICLNVMYCNFQPHNYSSHIEMFLFAPYFRSKEPQWNQGNSWDIVARFLCQCHLLHLLWGIILFLEIENICNLAHCCCYHDDDILWLCHVFYWEIVSYEGQKWHILA